MISIQLTTVLTIFELLTLLDFLHFGHKLSDRKMVLTPTFFRVQL